MVLIVSDGVPNLGRLRATTRRGSLHSRYTPSYREYDSERFGKIGSVRNIGLLFWWIVVVHPVLVSSPFRPIESEGTNALGGPLVNYNRKKSSDEQSVTESKSDRHGSKWGASFEPSVVYSAPSLSSDGMDILSPVTRAGKPRFDGFRLQVV